MPKRPNSCISYRVSCIYEAIRCLYSGGRVIGPRHFSPLRPFDSSPSLSLSNDPPSFSTTRRGGLGQVAHEKKTALPSNILVRGITILPREIQAWKSSDYESFDFQPKSFAETRASSTQPDLHTRVRIAARYLLLQGVRAHVTFPLSVLSRRYTLYTYINIHTYIYICT